MDMMRICSCMYQLSLTSTRILLTQFRPLYDIMNKKFIKFGIWKKKLSIDELTIPYFAHHSCKIFIRGKPIRFGYKLCRLCSSAGYLYNCIPYAMSAGR